MCQDKAPTTCRESFFYRWEFLGWNLIDIRLKKKTLIDLKSSITEANQTTNAYETSRLLN